jgi:hypothetical protein
MKTFNLWLEQRERRSDEERIKQVVMAALFSELTPAEAEGNINTEFETISRSKIHNMLNNVEIIKLLDGRDPHHILQTGTVGDFINFLVDKQNPVAKHELPSIRRKI